MLKLERAGAILSLFIPAVWQEHAKSSSPFPQFLWDDCVLNQCNTIFAMMIFDDTGKGFLANYMGADYADSLSTLSERQAVFFGRASSCENPILIRLNDRDKFLQAFRAENPPPAAPP